MFGCGCAGTLICNLESRPNDRGKYIRASGTVGAVVAQTAGGKTVIRLPSGQKKIVKGFCRAMVGVVAGGGRPEKPMLKAGRSYHKYKVKRNSWPRVSGVCMNPVEHPHGGGSTWGCPPRSADTAAPEERSGSLPPAGRDAEGRGPRSSSKRCCNTDDAVWCHVAVECLCGCDDCRYCRDTVILVRIQCHSLNEHLPIRASDISFFTDSTFQSEWLNNFEVLLLR